MRRLPKKIKIGPYTFPVVRVNKSELPDDELAHIDVNSIRIPIAKRIPREKVREIILHETLHGIHYLSGRYDDTPRSDEQWIDATVPMLLQVLRDNPELIAYLIDVKGKK
jgi:hypothetical protein